MSAKRLVLFFALLADCAGGEQGAALSTAQLASLDAIVDGLEGEVKAEADELEVEVKGLAPFTDVKILIGGASVAFATADGEGEVEFEWSTEDGDTLPLGAASVDELSGKSIEIRDAASDALLMSGTVPDVDEDDDDSDSDSGDDDSDSED